MTDFEYHDSNKNENLNPNGLFEKENKGENEEKDVIITLFSRTKRISKFSANIGILTLKYHMEKKHNIKIPQVITNQTKLSFSHIDLWLAKEKQE
ncbi:3172_t:CDS:2, partial [Funneliformis geosporum]